MSCSPAAAALSSNHTGPRLPHLERMVTSNTVVSSTIIRRLHNDTCSNALHLGLDFEMVQLQPPRATEPCSQLKQD
jgi:hypothetical protein